MNQYLVESCAHPPLRSGMRSRLQDAQDFRWSSWASPDAGWALNDRPTDRRCVGSWAYRLGLMQRATPRCLLLFSYLLPLVRTSQLMNNTNALR